MIANLILSLIAFALTPAIVGAQQQPGQSPAPAGTAKPASEPVIDASLWFVAFEPRVPANKLPLDLGAVAGTMAQQYGRGADGRIPTWGLARQLQANELEVVDGPHRLICREGKLVTETAKDRTADAGPPAWQIVSAPRILVALNQQGMVSVGRPIQFMTKQDNGCLRVESAPDLVEGVELKLTASKLLPEGIRFTGVSLKFSRVTGRQPIEGVPFDVGRPIIDTRETSLDITLDNGKLAVIPLPQADNEPALLVFLTARVVEEKK
jgi:hypothetical protein